MHGRISDTTKIYWTEFVSRSLHLLQAPRTNVFKKCVYVKRWTTKLKAVQWWNKVWKALGDEDPPREAQFFAYIGVNVSCWADDTAYKCLRRSSRICLIAETTEQTMKPVQFTSLLLTGTKNVYDTTQQERFAIKWAVLLFWPCLQGTSLTIRADHDSLKCVLNLSNTYASHARRLLQLYEPYFDCFHSAGVKHQTAAALLRLQADGMDTADSVHKQFSCIFSDTQCRTWPLPPVFNLFYPLDNFSCNISVRNLRASPTPT